MTKHTLTIMGEDFWINRFVLILFRDPPVANLKFESKYSHMLTLHYNGILGLNNDLYELACLFKPLVFQDSYNDRVNNLTFATTINGPSVLREEVIITTRSTIW